MFSGKDKINDSIKVSPQLGGGDPIAIGLQRAYLNSAKKEFHRYKMLGEKTFAQLKDEDLFWQYNAQSNSIAIIVKHMAGNMLSRWTDFLTTDGEKSWRNREAEFENAMATKTEMLTLWEKGWECLFNALDSIKEDEWQKPVFIRGEKHTVVEAINRQLAHYPHHVGQIIYIGRMIAGANWISPSIPKGDSEAFNASKFANPGKGYK